MIWLQAEEDEPFDNTYTSETNWCAEEVFSNDVLYVRHDLSGSAAEISALKGKLNEATAASASAVWDEAVEACADKIKYEASFMDANGKISANRFIRCLTDMKRSQSQTEDGN
jgi:hypothetical protein